MKIQLFLDIDINAIDSVNNLEFYEYIEGILQEQEVRIFISQELKNDLQEGTYDAYITNLLRILRKLIMQSNVWQHKSVANNASNFYYQLQGFSMPLDIKNTVKAEITERQINYEEICALIIFDKNQTENIYTIRENRQSFPKISQFTEIPYFQLLDKEKLSRFIENAKQKRIFRHNPKHNYIRFNKGAKANPDDRNKRGDAAINRLLFPLERQQEYAEILLATAITDDKTEKLYNIDNFPEVEGGQGRLVEFMPEKNVNYTYHAYHLEDIDTDIDIDSTLSYLSNELRNKLKELLKEN